MRSSVGGKDQEGFLHILFWTAQLSPDEACPP